MADPKYLDVVVGAVAQSMWRQDADGRLTLLRSLRDMLTHFVPTEDDPAPSEAKNTIMFALNPSNPWSATGINPDERIIWESFGFTPIRAKGWAALKVSPPLALLLNKTGMEPHMYQTIANYYGVDLKESDQRWELEHRVITVFSSGNPTPSNAMKWLSIKVPLEEIVPMMLRGYTPSQVKRLFERGETLATLKEKEPDEYPGPAYRKIKKAAQANGWSNVGADRSGYWAYSSANTVTLRKGKHTVTFGMGASGRVRKSFYVEGPNAANFASYYAYLGNNNGKGKNMSRSGLEGILGALEGL